MAKITLNIKKNAFNDVYYPYLFDYKRRYEIYYGGSGSGKSVFVVQKLIIKACNRKRKVLIIRKYATTLRDSVFQLVIDTLKKWGIYKYCKVNFTSFTITLPNGSVFLFKGMDDEEKIKSISGITDIFIEECTELSEEEYTQLDLRLREKVDDLQLLCAFNPISKANYVYKKWFAEDAVYNASDTLILRTTYKDNRWLPEAYIKALEAKIHTNPTYYKIYALGQFASLEKLVFYNWEVMDFNHLDLLGELHIGMDFGYTHDPSTLVASVIDESKKHIYIFKTYGETNKTNPQLASIIKSLGFAKSVIYADAAEPKSIAEIKKEGISRIRPCIKGKDSVMYGIQRLLNYKIFVHPSCEGIITEFENYSYKKDKKTGEYINEPIDDFNHYIDALRYSMSAENNKLKSVNKKALSL